MTIQTDGTVHGRGVKAHTRPCNRKYCKENTQAVYFVEKGKVSNRSERKGGTCCKAAKASVADPDPWSNSDLFVRIRNRIWNNRHQKNCYQYVFIQCNILSLPKRTFQGLTWFSASGSRRRKIFRHYSISVQRSGPENLVRRQRLWKSWVWETRITFHDCMETGERC